MWKTMSYRMWSTQRKKNMFEILTIFRKLYFLEFKFGLKFDWIWKPWWKFKIKCKSQNSKSSTPERDVFLLEIPLRFCAFNSPVPRWHMQYFLSLLKMRDMNAVSQRERKSEEMNRQGFTISRNRWMAAPGGWRRQILLCDVRLCKRAKKAA